MRFVFDAYNPKSEGVQNLKAELIARGHKVVVPRHNNSNFKRKPDDVLINWGRSKGREDFVGLPIINGYPHVAVAANKLDTFCRLTDELTPEFTTDVLKARDWLEEGHAVCARKILNGSGGEGLVIFDVTQDFVEAPLYVKYVKKKHEFRVHVFNDEIIDIQRKAVRPGVQNPNWKIRNLENGFIFARNELDVPQCVRDYSIAAVTKLILNFGAVDVIYNEREKDAYVLEVNTAPGLVGQTVNAYADALIESVT